MLSRRNALVSTSIASVLVFSAFLILPSRAASSAIGADWFGQEGNYPYNWNYNPQNVINANNAQTVGLQWAFPIPSAPSTAVVGSEGVVLTPMILNGITYFITDWNGVFAIDAHDGKIIWIKALPYNQTTLILAKGQPTRPGHYHGIWNTVQARGGIPLIWVVAGNYSIFALNALTGDINLKFNPLTRQQIAKIPGNLGFYDTVTPNMVIDDKNGILIFNPSGSENSEAGRGFFSGWDINSSPPKLLWTSFIIPPQDGSDPNWAIKSVANLSYAYSFDGVNQVDLKALSPSQQQSVLYGDWGTFAFDGNRSYTGGNGAWGGSYTVDPSTGIAYVATAQPSDDLNASWRPGPNLWTDSVIAVNEKTGKFIWAFQTTAHDLGDYDCAWSVLLANATISGQVHKAVMKACKNGYLYALDAATGKMFWGFNPPSIKRADGGVITLHNPLNKTQMTLKWQTYPSTKATVINPPGTGGIESNPAYDPVANLIFVTAYNAPSLRQCGNIAPTKGAPYGATGMCPTVPRVTPVPIFPNNATLWAVDVNTGKPVWSFDVSTVGFRGGVSVSGGVVYLPTADGFLRLLDEKNGKVLNAILIGGAMITQAAIGADAAGNYRIIIPVSTSSRTGFLNGIGITTPGYVAALSLPAASLITTTTAVSTTTALSTFVSTVQGPTTGIDPTTFYAAIGVAVIFVIATGVLAVRRRGPAT